MTETWELIRDHASLAEVRAGRAPSPELTAELSALLEVRGGWSYHHAARIAAFLGFSTEKTTKLFRTAPGVRHDATEYLEILAAHFRPKPRKAPAKPVDKEAVTAARFARDRAQTELHAARAYMKIDATRRMLGGLARSCQQEYFARFAYRAAAEKLHRTKNGESV